MAEYIEREALIEQINAQKRASKSSYPKQHFVVGDVLTCILTAPAADVAPVVHGKWAHIGGDEWCCTNCGFVIHTEGSWEKPEKKFCEDCGAKMDAGKLQKGAD